MELKAGLTGHSLAGEEVGDELKLDSIRLLRPPAFFRLKSSRSMTLAGLDTLATESPVSVMAGLAIGHQRDTPSSGSCRWRGLDGQVVGIQVHANGAAPPVRRRGHDRRDGHPFSSRLKRNDA